MKPKWTLAAILVAISLSLVCCSSSPEEAVSEAHPAIDQGRASSMDLAEMEEPETLAPPESVLSESSIASDSDIYLMNYGSRSDRLIVKDAQISLLVEDSATAINRTTQIVTDVNGYIISSQVWQQELDEETYQYSTITIGVPVDLFERALQRLRDIAIEVTAESASGEDVTEYYVDLESQVENLEATRNRIRGFLEQAETVEEALAVNDELSEVEGQIEELQGRMNYLENRSAYSTITVFIEPAPRESLRTPTPTPGPWSASETIIRAKRTLVSAYEVVFEIVLWLGIVVIPVLGPPAVIVGLIWYYRKRRNKLPGKEPNEKE